MPEIIQSPAFLTAAAITLIYQASKFFELNSVDPALARRVALFPNLKASDFAGRRYFYGALAAYFVTSFLGFLLLCLIPQGVVFGVLKNVLGLEITTDGVAQADLPIYIAALYVGLTQPKVPLFSEIGAFQRDVFHYAIGVPWRVVDTTDVLTMRLFGKATGRDDLAALVRTMQGEAWIVKLEKFADVGFYYDRLNAPAFAERLGEDRGADLSERELKGVVEYLVFAAGVATVRKSGGGGLPRLAEALGATDPLPAPATTRYAFVAPAAMFVVAVILMWSLVPIGEGTARAVLSDCPAGECAIFWPDTYPWALRSIFGNVVPVFVAVAFALHSTTLAELRTDAPGWGQVDRHLARHGLTLGAVLGLVLIYDFAFEFYAWYVNGQVYAGGSFADFVSAKALVFALHALISVAVVFGILIYFSAADCAQRRNFGWRWLAIMAVVVAVLCTLYANVSLAQYPTRSGLDFVVLAALLNIGAMVVAFAAAFTYYDRREPEKTALPQGLQAARG